MTDTREGPERFLLMKRGLYYQPNSAGYCGAKVQAGRYTEQEVAVYRQNARDEVTVIPEDEAAEFSPACWPETKVLVLTAERDTLRAERDEARDKALREAADLAQERADCEAWRPDCRIGAQSVANVIRSLTLRPAPEERQPESGTEQRSD
jgi:hypothetical protein